MDEVPVLSVEIHRDDTDVWTCPGPDRTGACVRAVPGALVPCGGGDLHVTSAPDDLWVFTVPQTSRACPLAWLVATPRRDGERGIPAVRNRSVWRV